MTSATTKILLPDSHKALVLDAIGTLPRIKTIPIPKAAAGNAIVKVEAANVISYSKYIYDGSRHYPMPTPLVIGASGIGRVVDLGQDATHLKRGQLVFLDPYIHGRDDHKTAFLFGIHDGVSEGSKSLMKGEWRDSTYAEYVKMPLENCFPLDEDLLFSSKLGYSLGDLSDIARLLVPYGGLSDIGVRPGQTIIVAPATGSFGSAAVGMALAMGARVIAVARNKSALEKVASSYSQSMIETVQITGDAIADMKTLLSHGPIDAFFDISPKEAIDSTHFRSCILSLRQGGKVSFMGGMGTSDLPLPMHPIVQRDIQIRGKWMYTRDDVTNLIRMVEFGMVKLDKDQADSYPLEEWSDAFDKAAEYASSQKRVVLVP